MGVAIIQGGASIAIYPYLSSVGVESRLFVIQLYSLGVETDSLRPVMGGKGFVAIVLERDSLVQSGSHVNGGGKACEQDGNLECKVMSCEAELENRQINFDKK